ncbi:FMN-binding negative transcriptional regulator, partial [Pseudomonas sp. UBA3153]|uniref:FMN-binding negative transcriptional regulator n=1 Tax=Pseudomonas sp. UBA3153 TaxID=1947313 RepID=UPI0039C8EF91
MPERSKGSGTAGMDWPCRSRHKWILGKANSLHRMIPSSQENHPMYVPTAFRQDGLAELHLQIADSRLAMLVSHAADGLQASHLPLLLV